MTQSSPVIKGYHAHVYYNADTFEQAKQLCEQAAKSFKLSLGHMHRQAVGPHPLWSCQLAFKTELLAELVPWLSVNRHGLTIFFHGISGNDLLDHTEYAFWMGTIEPLDLSIF